MKLIHVGGMVLGFGLVAPFALASDPVSILSPIEKIYVPQGFDDNDNAEVVFKGSFPSSCYKIAESSAKVDHEARTVVVTAKSWEYDGICADVVVPFIQAVDLGPLKEGSYAISVMGNSVVKAEISVARRSTESPDDYLYAPVNEAQLRVDRQSGRQTIELTGTYPYTYIGCMTIREVRVERDSDELIVVQPIAEIIDGEECEKRQGDQSFSKLVPLSQPIEDEGLIHVRVLNGDALNRYVEVY